jgi:hypothetical protein
MQSPENVHKIIKSGIMKDVCACSPVRIGEPIPKVVSSLMEISQV